MDQPNTPTYPAKDLELFPEILRGPNDPPYDPTRRPKYWIDPNQANAPDPTIFVSYKVFHANPDGSYAEVPIYLPASEAATTNFPDATPLTLPAGTSPPKYPAAWGFPVRDLLPNEKLLPTPFGLLVARTDLGNATPGTFTVDDHNAIMAIKAKLGA